MILVLFIVISLLCVSVSVTLSCPVTREAPTKEEQLSCLAHETYRGTGNKKLVTGD